MGSRYTPLELEILRKTPEDKERERKEATESDRRLAEKDKKKLELSIKRANEETERNLRVALEDAQRTAGLYHWSTEMLNDFQAHLRSRYKGM